MENISIFYPGSVLVTPQNAPPERWCNISHPALFVLYFAGILAPVCLHLQINPKHIMTSTSLLHLKWVHIILPYFIWGLFGLFHNIICSGPEQWFYPTAVKNRSLISWPVRNGYKTKCPKIFRRNMPFVENIHGSSWEKKHRPSLLNQVFFVYVNTWF